MSFDGRPFAIEDAIHTGVSQCAITHQHVLAQDAIEFGAEPFNGGAALTIKEMSTKFHGDAVQRFERMREQQQLAFCVHAAALDLLAIPGRADLDATMSGIDIQIGRHADRAAAGFLDHRKGQHRALLLQTHPPFDFGPQPLGRRNHRVPQLPQFAILQRFEQISVMHLRQRHERDALAVQA